MTWKIERRSIACEGMRRVAGGSTKAILVALAGLAISAASAQEPQPDPARLAAAERLLDAMHYERSLRANRSTPEAIVQGAANDCRRDHLSGAECKPRMEQADRLTTALVSQRDAMVPQIMNAARNAYATHLTVNEMDQATAFYVSPAGQKLVDELPAINVDLRAAEGRLLLQWMARQETAK